MATVLVGLVALLIVVWFANKFVQANPKGIGKVLQKGGGVLAIVAAVFLVSRGQRLPVASVLSPHEREGFAAALGAAIGEAKRGPTRTVVG